MNNRLDHVWFVNMIWFHVIFSTIQNQFSFIIPLKREANRYFSKLIMALLLYFKTGTKNVVSMTSSPFVKYFETLANHRKNSRFWCLSTYDFITGQNFSRISNVIYISTYYLSYVTKQFWLCSSPLNRSKKNSAHYEIKENTLIGGRPVAWETRKFIAMSSQFMYSSTISRIGCGIR